MLYIININRPLFFNFLCKYGGAKCDMCHGTTNNNILHQRMWKFVSLWKWVSPWRLVKMMWQNLICYSKKIFKSWFKFRNKNLWRIIMFNIYFEYVISNHFKFFKGSLYNETIYYIPLGMLCIVLYTHWFISKLFLPEYNIYTKCFCIYQTFSRLTWLIILNCAQINSGYIIWEPFYCDYAQIAIVIVIDLCFNFSFFWQFSNIMWTSLKKAIEARTWHKYQFYNWRSKMACIKIHKSYSI